MNLKNTKGSISIFVLIAVLFMASFLLITFAGTINKAKTIKEQVDIINGIYVENNNANEYLNAYDSAYVALRKGRRQILTASVENLNVIELNNTYEGKIRNYRIYGNQVDNVIQEATLLEVELPNEYQQLEYVESTGTQYIDTGVVATNTVGAYIKASLLYDSESLASDIYVMGSNTGGRFYGIGLYESVWRVGWGSKSTGAPSSKIVSSINLPYEKNRIYTEKLNWLNDGKVDIDGNEKALEEQTFTGDSIKLFYSHKYCECRIYNCKLSDGNNIIRDFIPCYRKSDGTVGMYDMINGVFYTNQGTGNFNQGNDLGGIYINEPLRKVGNYVDYIDYKTQKVYRYVGVINSYNGETITTDWISSTGELSQGATIYYGLTTPIEEDITMPELTAGEDYMKIEVTSNTTPSKIEVEYEGYLLE